MTKTDQAEMRRVLQALVKKEANCQCADCTAMNPHWASANLGLFVCIRCAGIHRSLGTHVSFVRSITIDNWTDKQFETMLRVGNERGRQYYEALKDNAKNPKPSQFDPDQAVKQYITDKYVLRKWINPSFPPPHHPMSPETYPQMMLAPEIQEEKTGEYEDLSGSEEEEDDDDETAPAPVAQKPKAPIESLPVPVIEKPKPVETKLTVEKKKTITKTPSPADGAEKKKGKSSALLDSSDDSSDEELKKKKKIKTKKLPVKVKTPSPKVEQLFELSDDDNAKKAQVENKVTLDYGEVFDGKPTQSSEKSA